MTNTICCNVFRNLLIIYHNYNKYDNVAIWNNSIYKWIFSMWNIKHINHLNNKNNDKHITTCCWLPRKFVAVHVYTYTLCNLTFYLNIILCYNYTGASGLRPTFLASSTRSWFSVYPMFIVIESSIRK